MFQYMFKNDPKFNFSILLYHALCLCICLSFIIPSIQLIVQNAMRIHCYQEPEVSSCQTFIFKCCFLGFFLEQTPYCRLFSLVIPTIRLSRKNNMLKSFTSLSSLFEVIIQKTKFDRYTNKNSSQINVGTFTNARFVLKSTSVSSKLNKGLYFLIHIVKNYDYYQCNGEIGYFD